MEEAAGAELCWYNCTRVLPLMRQHVLRVLTCGGHPATGPRMGATTEQVNHAQGKAFYASCLAPISLFEQAWQALLCEGWGTRLGRGEGGRGDLKTPLFL